MNYQQHAGFNLIIATIISILALIYNNLLINQILFFWIGIMPYTFLITCDLDSENSIVRQLWGPLKLIWYPFVDAGHREILHNPLWGPFILISFLWIPFTLKGIDVPQETILGAVVALESHIVADCIYSDYQKVKKSWIGKIVEKVI